MDDRNSTKNIKTMTIKLRTGQYAVKTCDAGPGNWNEMSSYVTLNCTIKLQIHASLAQSLYHRVRRFVKVEESNRNLCLYSARCMTNVIY